FASTHQPALLPASEKPLLEKLSPARVLSCCQINRSQCDKRIELLVLSRQLESTASHDELLRTFVPQPIGMDWCSATAGSDIQLCRQTQSIKWCAGADSSFLQLQ